MDAEPSPPYQRDESAAQRLDRNWNELLQEIRVLQTGSQILAAFLIVLPFQSRFEELDAFQTGWYLGLLLLEIGRASCRERVEIAGVAAAGRKMEQQEIGV